jgi:hypothetical protein
LRDHNGMQEIIYIGPDHIFSEELKKHLLSFGLEKEFISIEQKKEVSFGKLLGQIKHCVPSVLILDFSSHFREMEKVLLFLSKIHPFDHATKICCFREGTSTEQRKFLLVSGAHFLFVKSQEFTQPLGFIRAKLQPEKPINYSNVFKKKVNLQLDAVCPLRIGYMTNEYIRIESDFPLGLEEIIQLRTSIFPDFPFEAFKVEKETKENLYYHYKHSFDLSHQDESLLENKSEKKKKSEFYDLNGISERIELRDKNLELGKKQIDQFLKNGKEQSYNKRERLLFFDREVEFLSHIPKAFYGCGYSLRGHQILDPDGMSIKTTKASIICFFVRDASEQEVLKRIATEVKIIEGYNPFIIIFDPEGLCPQSIMGDRIVYQNEKFQAGELLKLLDIFHEKKGRERTHDISISSYENESRHFFNKYLPSSVGFIFLSINILEICEYYVYFSCDRDLAQDSFIQIKILERELTLTIVKMENFSGSDNEFFYRGLINNLEDAKANEIRKFIMNDQDFD